jgi:hypothetical protein
MIVPGNFVCAALPSIYTHLTYAIRDHPDYLEEDKINNFMKENINKYLTTVGKHLVKGRPVTKEVFDKYVTNTHKAFESTKWLNGCELIIDSGGYQIQQGYVDRKYIPDFIDLYYNYFIKNNSNSFNYAFHLDLAPGSVHCPFNSFADMEELNRYSYGEAKKMDQSILDKMIYVHHFRTPKIHQIYNKLLFDEDMADGIKNFSTGGLVTFGKLGSDIPPYILYIIPLLEIIHYCRQKKIKKFRFHVLGGSEWKEILGHKFFERHIKEIFDIEVQITFDSSTFFKAVCLGRYFFKATDQGIIKRIDFRQSELDKYVNNKEFDIEHKTSKELYFQLINDVI